MISALALSLLFAAMLGVRYLRMSYHAQNWFGICAVYVAARAPEEGWDDETKVSRLMECAAVWPMSQMMRYFWVWDFRAFIVSQHDMHLVLDFFAARSRVEGDERNT